MYGEPFDSGIIQKHFDDIVLEFQDPRIEESKQKIRDLCALLEGAHKNLEAEIRKRKASEDALLRCEEQCRLLEDQKSRAYDDDLRHYRETHALAINAGSIAHDFNNLIMGIQGNISLILAKIDPSSELYARLKKIEQYTNKGTELTGKILGSAADRKRKAEQEKTYSDGPGMRTETVLLVDDELMVRDVATEMLKAIGCRVIVARNGAEAIELYKEEKHEIDLVILDMIMPQMSGSDTFDRLKMINAAVKVLLSSGYCLDGQASEILKRGCSGFIQKPYDIRALSGKIQEIADTCDSSRT